MDDLVNYQPHMHASTKRQTDARISKIHQIATSTKAAMEAQASVYRYGWFTRMAEANQAGFTLQAYLINHPDGSAEIAYQEWLADLDANFNLLYSVFGDKLLQIIAGIPTEAQPVGFFEELLNQFYILFFDEKPSTDPYLDQIHQLEMQAKSTLDNTARKHSNSLPDYLRRGQMGSVEVRNEP